VFPILETKEIAKNVLPAADPGSPVAKKRKAGQFPRAAPHRRRREDPADDRLLRRPGRVRDDHLPGGREIDHRVRPDEDGRRLPSDVVGPSGYPPISRSSAPSSASAAGIGTAPCSPSRRPSRRRGNRLLSIVGALDEGPPDPRGRDAAGLRRIVVTTDDGSYAKKGFVTTALQGVHRPGGDRSGCASGIGPVPMMRAVAEVDRPHGIKTMVSLNPIMVDATGMCGACRSRWAGRRSSSASTARVRRPPGRFSRSW